MTPELHEILTNDKRGLPAVIRRVGARGQVPLEWGVLHCLGQVRHTIETAMAEAGIPGWFAIGRREDYTRERRGYAEATGELARRILEYYRPAGKPNAGRLSKLATDYPDGYPVQGPALVVNALLQRSAQSPRQARRP